LPKLIGLFVFSDNDHVSKVSINSFPVFHQQKVAQQFEGRNNQENDNEVFSKGQPTDYWLFKKTNKCIKHQKEEYKLYK